MKRLGLTEGRKRLQEGKIKDISNMKGFQVGDTITGATTDDWEPVEITILNMEYNMYIKDVYIEYKVTTESGDSSIMRSRPSEFFRDWLK